MYIYPQKGGVGGFGVYDGRTVGGQSSCSMARARNSPHAKKSYYSKKSKKFLKNIAYFSASSLTE